MRKTTQHFIRLGNRRVTYRLSRSPTARKLRVRVGPSGIEVIQPAARPRKAVTEFLRSNQGWLLGQVDRVSRLGDICRTSKKRANEILLRGIVTPVRIEPVSHKRRENRVIHNNGEIVIRRGPDSRTPPNRSLENWLRHEARREIEDQMSVITTKLKRLPNRVYVMNQRTKWGNCSAKQNLSFNWRLIMAPPFVLRYLVTHEVVHLAIPDHSSRFWLTLRSLCPEMEKAKHWLSANAHKLLQSVGVPKPR
jgi:hypothetical protein